MQNQVNLFLAIKTLLKQLSLSLILLIFIFIICLWSKMLVGDIVFEDKNILFDKRVFSLISPFINDTNTAIAEIITFFGSSGFLLPAYILIILFFIFIKKRNLDALKIAAISITSTLVLFLLKDLLHRARPLVPLISKAHGYSFPSGHTCSSVIFYGMLSYITYKNFHSKVLRWFVIALLVLLTLMIGFTRIFLKLHYATDVIAGLSLGFIWLLIAKWVLVKTAKIPSY